MKRTWPYGTRKNVTVLHWIGGPVACALVVQADDDPIAEVHCLLGEPRDFPPRVRAGERGTITFTRGGPTGGHWRYEPLDAGVAAVNAAVAEAAETVTSETVSC